MVDSSLLIDAPATPVRPIYPPTVLVCVPRAVCERYWSLPWAEVIAAAEKGSDGITVERDLPFRYIGRMNERNPRPDVAFLREGDKGRTFLYQQNW